MGTSSQFYKESLHGQTQFHLVGGKDVCAFLAILCALYSFINGL